MWIIKLEFIGDQGFYTKEEESASCETYAKMKYERMINKWADILKIPIIGEVYYYDDENKQVNDKVEYKLELIKLELKRKNKITKTTSTFEIKMFEQNDNVI